MEPRIGVIGGSGLYEMEGLEGVRRESVGTPFGPPSDAYVIGELAGRPVAFLARHARGHRLLPTELNYRANIYGFKTLGVEFLISVSAVGSMNKEYAPGHIVVPHQFFDRTRHRPDTFFGQGIVAHTSLARPVSLALAGVLLAAGPSPRVVADAGLAEVEAHAGNASYDAKPSGIGGIGRAGTVNVPPRRQVVAPRGDTKVVRHPPGIRLRRQTLADEHQFAVVRGIVRRPVVVHQVQGHWSPLREGRRIEQVDVDPQGGDPQIAVARRGERRCRRGDLRLERDDVRLEVTPRIAAGRHDHVTRVGSPTSFFDGSMQNKMFDVGVGGNGESRFILHQEKPHPTTPCGLPQGDAPHWGSFSIKKGITETCTPPVRITYNRWYHVQLAVQASIGASTNDGSFRLWVNNNNADKPSSKRLKVDITSTYWNHGFGFGGFITDYPARDQGWVVDDLQISTEFDPHWYPDAAD